MNAKHLALLSFICVGGFAPCDTLAYEIGHTSFAAVDTDRDRVVPIEVFYPADQVGDNVPVASSGGLGFPAVAIGHGFLIPWDAYDHLWEPLVQSGFIVGLPRTANELMPNHLEFGLDLAFVIRFLQDEGADSESILFGGLSSTSAVVGHSMGGGACYLACASDPSITTIITLAAAETNPSAIEAAVGIQVPALVLAGSVDCVAPPEDHQIPAFNSLASDCKTLITLTGGSHCQFAEDNLACTLGEMNCPTPGISRLEQQYLVNSLLLPWMESHLRNDIDATADFENLIAQGDGFDAIHDCDSTDLPRLDDAHGSASDFFCRSYPNPSNPTATIEFYLPELGVADVSIYNLRGQLIWTHHGVMRSSGIHQIHWAGRDEAGRQVPSGNYVYSIKCNGIAKSGMILIQR